GGEDVHQATCAVAIELEQRLGRGATAPPAWAPPTWRTLRHFEVPPCPCSDEPPSRSAAAAKSSAAFQHAVVPAGTRPEGTRRHGRAAGLWSRPDAVPARLIGGPAAADTVRSDGARPRCSTFRAHQYPRVWEMVVMRSAQAWNRVGDQLPEGMGSWPAHAGRRPEGRRPRTV